MSSIFASIISSVRSKALTAFVNEANGIPCWTDAKVKEVEIISDAANSDVPLSTEQLNETSVYSGLLSADIKTAKIILPVRLKIEILTNNLSLVQNIRAAFADKTRTIKVVSKSITATSMAVTHVTITQSPGMLSAARLLVFMEQTQPQQQQTFNPMQSADASNLGLGVQTLNTVGPSLSTVGNGIGSLVSTATTAVGALYQRFIQNIES